MRTTLFLSTLFAVTLVGGAALADKPHDAGQAREPRVVELTRAHGDVVDKSYTSPDRASRAADRSVQTGTSTRQTTRNPIDKSASRVNCSETGADCGAKGGAARSATAESSSSASNRVGRTPAFLDKILGTDRTNFNEADMDEGMSTRAANRAWQHAGAAHHGSSSHAEGAAAASLAAQKQVSREDEEHSGTRMGCNDADQCSSNTKAVKAEWSYAAVRAGTWQGPDKPVLSPAAVRIRDQRAAEGHTVPQGGKEGHAGGSSAQHDDAH
jgi:hypothetical protein